jgi:hypothetical protein
LRPGKPGHSTRDYRTSSRLATTPRRLASDLVNRPHSESRRASEEQDHDHPASHCGPAQPVKRGRFRLANRGRDATKPVEAISLAICC